MGHRIAVLDHGVLQQVGAPQDVYARPANLFVARFIGSPPMNTVTGGRRPRRRELVVQIPGGVVELPGAARRCGRSAGARNEVVIGVRPEDLRFDDEGGPIRATVSRGRVARPRAPRRVPARRRSARDRAAGRARRLRRPRRATIGLAARPGGAPRLRRRIRGTRGRMSSRPTRRWTCRGGRPPSPRPRKRRFSRAVREAGLGYLLLIPSFLIFGVFVFYPLVHNFVPRLLPQPAVPGAAEAPTSASTSTGTCSRRRTFLDSLKITVLFAIITVPVGIALGLCLAILAHQQLKGIGIYRTFFSSTVATSVAVAAVIFGTLHEPAGRPAPWLASPPTRPSCRTPTDHQHQLPVIGASSVGRAGRGGGDDDVADPRPHASSSCRRGSRACPTSSTRRRGSTAPGAWSRFWHVTLPMMSPTIFFAVVDRHDLRLPVVRPDRHPHPGRAAEEDQRAHLLHLRHAAATERSRQGGGARGRAVRPHADPRAGADPAARAAGVV